jgi:hypothetical protein
VVTASGRPRRNGSRARIVDAANVDETDELALGIVAQEGHQLDQVSRRTVRWPWAILVIGLQFRLAVERLGQFAERIILSLFTSAI